MTEDAGATVEGACNVVTLEGPTIRPSQECDPAVAISQAVNDYRASGSKMVIVSRSRTAMAAMTAALEVIEVGFSRMRICLRGHEAGPDVLQ